VFLPSDREEFMGGLRRIRRQSAARYAVEPLRRDAGRPSEKLSAVILDFAKTLTDHVDDSQFKSAIDLAILCWNLSLLPEDQQEKERLSIVRKLAQGRPDWFARDTEAWTRTLLDRKKTFFEQDRRMVANYQVVDEGDDFHLYVASTVVPR
jgi:hypothetical protein